MSSATAASDKEAADTIIVATSLASIILLGSTPDPSQLATTFPARVEQGPQLPSLARLPYFPEDVQRALAGVHTILRVGAEAPVSFFAYEGVPSDLTPEGAQVLTLADHQQMG